MAKYRKKPVIIEAFKWTGDYRQTEDPIWIINALRSGTARIHVTDDDVYMIIKTLEGDHRADLGDYIIQGIKGEIYPCKSDIFELTYDKYEHMVIDSKK